MRNLVGLGLLCLWTFPATAPAQEQRPDLVGVKAWRGTITATAKEVDGNVKVGGQSMKVSYSGSFSAEFLLDQFDDEPATWSGKLISSNLSVTSTMSVTAGNVKIETSTSTNGPVDAREGPEAKLTFHRERGWAVYVMRNGRRAKETQVTTLDDKVFTATNDRSVHALKNVRNFPYPKQGFDLEGSTELTPNESAGDFPIVWKYSAHLWPADRQMLTLEIEDSPAYAEWRPSTTRDAAAGVGLDVKATVVASDGKAPNEKVESFVWELVKTSREPGVAMNYPVGAKDDRFDLGLTTQGGFFVVSNDAQRVERPVQEALSDTVTVLPFDWGGWADLQVTAVLKGGRKLVGKVKGAPENGLRLPKRAANSYVADCWKKGKTGTGPDDCDFDDVPGVPSHKGDGLTLYEEYRGFYEKGAHKDGDPGTKDLFVLDTTKGRVDGGLAKFQTESKVVIHRLADDEMDAKDRVINRNRAKGPHLVAQHGILIRFLPKGDTGMYMACQPQGAVSPGGVQAILVPAAQVNGPPASDGSAYEDVSFAHEMLHAVGVRHHGDGDYGAYWKIDGARVLEFRLDDAETGLSGPGVPIEIQREDGVVITDKFIARRAAMSGETKGRKNSEGQEQLVGVEQGESSGDDTCLMRYDRNGAYVKKGQPNVRVIIQADRNPEPVGCRICKSRTGTGINAASPGPSRYGNAAPGRGECLLKIKISDF
jgi:hypothetical protein